MSRVVWDSPKERLFTTGIDRGVLYLNKTSHGVPWNGLVSFEQVFDDANFSIEFDGPTTFFHATPSEFKAVLTAYTYPDEFLQCQGIEETLKSHLQITNQKIEPFHLTYRSFVKNDTSSGDSRYYIHILYNLVADPQSVEYVTFSDHPDMTLFKWNIVGTPESISGFRPTAHVIIDSQEINPDFLVYLEDTIYGSSTQIIRPAEFIFSDVPSDNTQSVNILSYTPSAYHYIKPAEINAFELKTTAILPSLEDLLNLAVNFEPQTLSPNSVSGFSVLMSGGQDVTPTRNEGVFFNLPESKLVGSNKSGFYIYQS